eukprot:3200130-Alexandrium_andersonii.AAC.1
MDYRWPGVQRVLARAEDPVPHARSGDELGVADQEGAQLRQRHPRFGPASRRPSRPSARDSVCGSSPTS